MSSPRRHLTFAEAAAALGRGRQVEQFLAQDDKDGSSVVRGCDRRAGHPARASLYRIDATVPDTVDLTAAWPILEADDDEAYAEITGSPEEVLQAAQRWGAEPGRWVNMGVAGSEFEHWLAQRSRGDGV